MVSTDTVQTVKTATSIRKVDAKGVANDIEIANYLDTQNIKIFSMIPIGNYLKERKNLILKQQKFV